MTPQEFRSDQRFKAFAETSIPTVTAAIAMASRMWDATACGDLYQDVVAYQTAVILWTGPGGAPASKTRTTYETPYDAMLKQLLALCRQGPIVASSCP